MFLRELLRHLHGPIIVLLDNSTTHQGEPLRKLLHQHPRLRIEHFPAYAPELNPDEGVWALAKGELANSCPKDVEELVEDIIRSIDGIGASRQKLRGCILQSELPIFFALSHSIIYADTYSKQNVHRALAQLGATVRCTDLSLETLRETMLLLSCRTTTEL